LAQERRGEFIDMKYLTTERVLMRYFMPLAEILVDFHDVLKSLTKGYASFDYEPMGYKAGDLVKLEILVAGETLDALSYVVHKDRAYSWGLQVNSDAANPMDLTTEIKGLDKQWHMMLPDSTNTVAGTEYRFTVRPGATRAVRLDFWLYQSN
jgi:hypothetical protein